MGPPFFMRQKSRLRVITARTETATAWLTMQSAANDPKAFSVITTHALFARKVQRKLSNGVAGFAAEDHLLNERDRGQFVPSRRRRMMAKVRAERLLKIPAEPSPELRIPGAAAQTRVVSMAGIRLGSWESARAFKGIICDDISEFESHMPSHAVRSPPIIPRPCRRTRAGAYEIDILAHEVRALV
jgi:hypothetical protein